MLQVGTTILTSVSSLHLTALGVREELSTVADAEYRNAADKLAQIYLESFRIIDVYKRQIENSVQIWLSRKKLVNLHAHFKIAI